MSDTLPTVKVKADNEQGFIVINEADFDQATHELFAEAKEDGEKPAKKPAKKDAE